MKSFNIPEFYRSNIITPIKEFRRRGDKLKRDYSPTVLDFGPVVFLIARHFGFCYGVENAIDIAYKAIEENPDKRIFLLSEMIHNPDVNKDLTDRGIAFLMDTKGKQMIPWASLTKRDIVIVPAFGTTVEIQAKLTELGIDAYKYDTTCPFVEKVWNRASQIGAKDYTIVVHGKPLHEETRATFSHSKENAPTVVVENMAQAGRLASYMMGETLFQNFYEEFKGQYSEGFNPEIHLKRIGVVNQTTMLASDTQQIADFLKQVMIQYYDLAPDEVENHFANTRDTLCYATNDNQDATYSLLKHPAHMAIVAGGYNSSNTSHLVELCEEKLPTYFISSAGKLLGRDQLLHYDLHSKTEIMTEGYLPESTPVRILLTSGASCPDAVVDEILVKILSFFDQHHDIRQVLDDYLKSNTN